ncbi:hypothetical protein KGQ20_38065 [Catenulispora sp. NF23]|uniref:hypothetical protein n=1 Tax=Catenulispora pinistramenti TaxID=2705254 RepID=UPI001BA741CA|nr:hypothetical protein [Catenulispora pinistramenti]MBS2538568.1 hypothetical protein [Catenulispora pinistramenti]
MAFEVEVPVRHRTMWLAFTDPEKMARAVPGLTVDAVHTVPPADGPEGVAGDVVAGRLKLRVGAGGAGATITYRGTACIAGAEAHNGTLDIAVDGALAGYLRVTLGPAGDAGERTVISVVPELELSGRALEFGRADWHEAVETLGAAWIETLAAEFRDAVEAVEAEEASQADEVAAPAVVESLSNKSGESESEKITNPPVVPAASPALDESLSDDPLAAVWSGRYEKNRWLPLITALTLFLLIKRRRRHRADKAGADSSFRME